MICVPQINKLLKISRTQGNPIRTKKGRWKSSSVTVTVSAFVAVIGKWIFPLNSISSCVHCPSVPLLSGEGSGGTEAGLQAASLRPLAGSAVSLEAPWPTALFSSFPNEVGKVNKFGGRRRRGLLGRCVRQACGCQRAGGRLPNSCRVWESEWTTHWVSVWSGEGATIRCTAVIIRQTNICRWFLVDNEYHWVSALTQRSQNHQDSQTRWSRLHISGLQCVRTCALA